MAPMNHPTGGFVSEDTHPIPSLSGSPKTLQVCRDPICQWFGFHARKRADIQEAVGRVYALKQTQSQP